MTQKNLESFLNALEKLEERPLPLSDKAARGREAPLFKAHAKLDAEDLGSDAYQQGRKRLIAALAVRLGDASLLPAVFDLAAQDSEAGDELMEALQARRDDQDIDIWGAERLLWWIEDSQGETDLGRFEDFLALEAKDFTFDDKVRLLEIRSRTPKKRRDPVSTQLLEGIARSLSQHAELEEAQSWIQKTIVWEAARMGKDEPTVALAAIEALKSLDSVVRLRLCRQLLNSLKRRVCIKRVEAILEETRTELALPESQLNDLMALALEVSEWVDIDLGGELVFDSKHEHYEIGAERQYRREIDSILEQWTTRLEQSIILGEAWPFSVWKSIFPGSGCFVRGNFTKRLLWQANDGDKAYFLRWDGDGFVDVFGEPCGEEFTDVKIAHPLFMDKEELSLWREFWKDYDAVQPIPQLYRLCFKRPPTKSFVGCHFPMKAPNLGRARTFVGMPLRGRGDWEVTRSFGENMVTLYISSKEQKISSIDWDFEPDELTESEFCRDLFDLVGTLFFGDSGTWSGWNTDLRYDAKGSWDKALTIYKKAPKRLPALRRKVLDAVMSHIEGHENLRYEGRFVVIEGEGGGIVELGSGHLHRLQHRTYVPPRDEAYKELKLPHNRELDPHLDRIMGLIAYLAQNVLSQSTSEV